MATKRHTATRQAYEVEVNFKGEQVIQEYTCVLTPKRVAVTCEGGWQGAMYYEPDGWPARGAAWTIEEAWEKFIATKRNQLESLKADVAWVESQIAAAEKCAPLRARHEAHADYLATLAEK